MKHTAASTDQKCSCTWTGRIFFYLTLITGVMLLTTCLVFLPAAWRRDASKDWPMVPGLIRATGLKLEFQKTTPYYSPQVIYTYTAGGIQRIGNRIDFSDGPMRLEKEQALQWLQSNYPLGKEVTVHVDPADSDFAVLTPGAPALVTICYDIIITLGVCFCVALALWQRARRRAASFIAAPYSRNPDPARTPLSPVA